MTKTLLLSLALVVIAGCTGDVDKSRATIASPVANPNFQHYNFNLPPQQLLTAAQRVITNPPWSLPIESVSHGVITTGWKNYQGAHHVVRYWQERTRFQVAVYPDFDNPTAQSTLRVTQETQTRASDKGDWFALLDYDRSDRAADLAKAIQQSANGAR